MNRKRQLRTAKSKGLTLDEYQKKSFKLAFYPNKGENFTYTVLGICGEAGKWLTN